MSTLIAEVILDHALDHPLDYLIPSSFPPLEIGTRVEVPLRSKAAKGIILLLKEKSSFPKLLSISKILEEKPLISKTLLELAVWISKYYCSPLSKVLKMFLPKQIRNQTAKPKVQLFIKPLVSANQMATLCTSLRKSSPAQAKALEQLLQSPQGLFLSKAIEKGVLSAAPFYTLAKKKILQIQEVQVDRSAIFSHDFFPTNPKTLHPEQQLALDQIIKDTSIFQTHLLYGITGSGKTEIYLQTIQHVLAKQKSILYLVPEIALISQTIETLKGRFGGEKIAILHHQLSPGEKFDTWHKIQSTPALIIVGARSAVFSPISDLGLIIIDEEQEAAYKQNDDSPKYSGRDVAIVRAKLEQCPIILGSATPSFESYFNACTGKYTLHLLTKRADKAALANVTIVDMKKEKEKKASLFSDLLLQKIKDRLMKGEQTLLFLNRRGYYTSSLCQMCSFIETCPDCDVALTYHRGENILSCHLCDFRKIALSHCPKCQKETPLIFKGIGTERLQEMLQKIFPNIRSLRLDADTTKHKGSHQQIFKAFRLGKADLLIGTQMIAKGLHFPLVTLVGILGFDHSLSIPDFRASEKAFQLLTQVAGRSGRELQGEVILQTHLPENSTILHAKEQNYETFYKEEIEIRKAFGFPPFFHLIKCNFSGKDSKICEQKAQEFRQLLGYALSKTAEILPVIPCGYAKVKGDYRFQFLIKAEKIGKILKPLASLRASFQKQQKVKLAIDVNPLTTFF